MELCDVDSSLGSLYSAEVDGVACFSKVHVASVFRIEVCRVGEFPHIHSTVFTLYTVTLKTGALCTSKTARVLASTWCKDQRADHHKVNHTESLKLMIIPLVK
jgi:hypothetical protein